jgi:prepilin-type N-terminal cleavage/methylation domain-containing protein
MRRGFTLIELLVVILIILIVSAVALPTVLPALAHRQVSEGARILQGAIAGARDSALRDNAPAGIRLLPDPAFNGLGQPFLADGVTPNPQAGILDPKVPLAYNRIIPIEPAPQYSEGLVTIRAAVNYPVAFPAIFPSTGAGATATPTQPTNVLILEEAPGTWTLTGATYTYLPNPPTNWFWTVRVGDKVQINNAGPWLTVIGPLFVPPGAGNSELFVNVGASGVGSSLSYTSTAPDGITTQTITPEYLMLVNGLDDNHNGFVDEEWDGVDNDGDGNIDNNNPSTGKNEWIENEQWPGALGTQIVTSATYTIQRRPTPTINAREVALPSNVVIDASSWNLTNERTRVPGAAFNQFSGAIEFLVNPDGTVVPTTIYSTPTSIGMSGAFFHFWLAERSDIYAPPATANGGTQNLMASLGVTGFPFLLPQPRGADVSGANPYDALVATTPSLPVLKGEMRIVTLFTRSGQISTNDNPSFNVLSVDQPYIQAQQGVSGGQQ